MTALQEIYCQDFDIWAEETAAALRAGRWTDLDVEHLAEEIEDMSRRNARELESRMTRILEHLLKLRIAGGAILHRNQRGWQASIIRQRTEIEALLRESPSLKCRITAESIEACYERAAAVVAAELGLDPPRECPFGPQDVLPDLAIAE
jgi:hypothetical protein